MTELTQREQETNYLAVDVDNTASMLITSCQAVSHKQSTSILGMHLRLVGKHLLRYIEYHSHSTALLA